MKQLGLRNLALAYHAASAVLSKVGEADLSWIASDRALAPRVDSRALPVERRVRHALEVAKVYSLVNRDQDALAVVLSAEREAPEQVRYHYLARELVLTWMRRHGTTPRPELVGLAQRLRVA